jgi:hypothetical protein
LDFVVTFFFFFFFLKRFILRLKAEVLLVSLTYVTGCDTFFPLAQGLISLQGLKTLRIIVGQFFL